MAQRIVISLLLLTGCSTDLLSGSGAKKGLAAIAAKLETTDLKVSRVEITKDKLMVYAQHPKNPKALTEVEYYPKTDSVGFGGPVRISGGTAEDVLFRTATIDFGLVSKVVKTAKQKSSHSPWLVKLEHGLSAASPSLWTVEIEGGDLAMFNVDGSLDSFTTRAEREKMGAHFD